MRKIGHLTGKRGGEGNTEKERRVTLKMSEKP